MMKCRRYWNLLLVVISTMGCFTSIASVSAQPESDAPTPLLQMFELVPEQLGHGDLYFNDFRAIEQAYPPARMPANWSEFEALNAGDATDIFPVEVWWHVFQNTLSPIGYTAAMGEEVVTSMGIDFFDIDRSLIDFREHDQIYYLRGIFDLASIQSALSARGFSPQPSIEDIELWCGAVGCENGDNIDPYHAVPGDFFGGDLGRQLPRFIAPKFMIGASRIGYLLAIGDTIDGETPSLADDSRYAAAIEAVRDQGVLLQALIPSVESTLGFYELPETSDPRITAAQYAAFIDTMLEQGYETLPAFDLIMFADMVSETEQIAEVVLVYSSEDEAEQAAPILLNRIENYQSLRMRRPIMELFEQVRVEEVTADVVTVGNRAVVRLKAATRKETPDEIVQVGLMPPDVTASGRLYRILIETYDARDLGWLTLVPRSELEALASGS